MSTLSSDHNTPMSLNNANDSPARLYEQGTRAEQAKDWDKAFRLYINAAEGFLRESRNTVSEPRRLELKAEASKALGRAEQIKRVKGEILRPVVRDPFSPDEQDRVLDQSSTLNGLHLSVWDSVEQGKLSLDQPRLSLEQEEQGTIWERVAHEETSSSVDPSPRDIEQRVISDCSVCASIITCLEHRKRFQSKLLGNILFPQPDGVLHARLFLNGAFRRVGARDTIDQTLPVAVDGRFMCLNTSSGSNWPAFVEKAYLKAMAGYDFQGSDSSTDLLALTGWIPEYMDTQGPDFASDRTWSRIHEGFNRGHCLITLGTGQNSDFPEAARTLGLFPRHCYAVIAVDESDDDWHLTILDPFVPDAGAAMKESPANEYRERGVIKLTWEDACNMFCGIYMSWNPESFGHQLTFHGTWKPYQAFHEDSVFVSQSRLIVTIPSIASRQELCIILLRHVRKTDDDSNYIALHAQREEVVSGGRDDHVLNEHHTFTKATYVMTRLTLPAAEEPHRVSIISLHEGIESQDVGYTVMVYCQTPIHWEKSNITMPFSKQAENSFTSSSAGGNSTYPSFMANPQYRLRVHAASASTGSRASKPNELKVSVLPGRDLPINVMVVWSNGTRVFEVAQADLAMDSGAYTYGFATTSKPIRPGDYTIIVSAHSPRYYGSFKLHVESTERFDLDPIPQEGAGMYTKSATGEWAGHSAAGGPSSGSYNSNPMFELRATSSSKIMVRLQLVEYIPSVPINITLFGGTPTDLGRHISTSGPYSDALPGIVTPLTPVPAGTYLLVPSTFRPGIQTRFRIMVYSTSGGTSLTRMQ